MNKLENEELSLKIKWISDCSW